MNKDFAQVASKKKEKEANRDTWISLPLVKAHVNPMAMLIATVKIARRKRFTG